MSRSKPAEPLCLSDVAPLLRPYVDGACPGIVLAVSGGPDSVALLRLVAHVRADLVRGEGAAAPVTVATVDHGRRPESRAEAEAVAGWAASCGLPHHLLSWDGPKPASGLQEAAREARYGLLAGLARAIGASHVLTAHTLDDQAETVLMRLARGTGPGGLAGMRAQTPLGDAILARPFLALGKARLLATCRAQGWPFVEDPTNVDPRFARPRLRRLMPLLAAEGLTPERLAVLARRMQRVEDALGERASRALAAARVAEAPARLELSGAELLREPDAILLRIVEHALAVVLGAGKRPVRLERLEGTVLGRLRPALAAGAPLRTTLAGALIEVGRDGRVVLSPEPPRRRGRTAHPAERNP